MDSHSEEKPIDSPPIETDVLPTMVEGQVTFDVGYTIGSPLSNAFIEPVIPHEATVSMGFFLANFPLDPGPSQPERPNDWYLSVLRDMGDLPPLSEPFDVALVQSSPPVIETQPKFTNVNTQAQ